MQPTRARVAVVFTGGTISMLPDAAAGGARPALNGAAILARVPLVGQIADVEAIDWGLVPASHLGFDQLLDLARLLERTLARSDIAGAVVVQGTDTLEETAFAWDLLVGSNKPVVVTGAMRNAAAPDYDGPRNLADAIRCAADPSMRGTGVTVCMAGAIVPADTVVKSSTSTLDTFQPRDGDALGQVDDAGVRLARKRTGRQLLPDIPAAAAEPVLLLTVVTGMDGGALRALRQLEPRGVVIAATGRGNTHPDLLAAATELMAAGCVVCLTTRCAHGEVAPEYAFPGGGAEWLAAGAILSGLDGPKARIALGLGLAAELDRYQLAELLHVVGQ